jgi:hypothetical protein
MVACSDMPEAYVYNQALPLISYCPLDEISALTPPAKHPPSCLHQRQRPLTSAAPPSPPSPFFLPRHPRQRPAACHPAAVYAACASPS